MEHIPPPPHPRQMAGVGIAFSGSFSGNRFSLPISTLFLTRVDYHSYSLLSRLLTLDGTAGGTPTPTSQPPFLVGQYRRWNTCTESFELPFHGRANSASERNFQLVKTESGQRPNGAPVVLLHGKLDADTFALDYTYPLSPLHAFALALVTWSW